MPFEASVSEEEVKQRLAQRIRQLRESAGLSQEALAHAAGNLSRPYLGQLERGAKGVGLETLVRIADALRVDVADLLARHEKAAAGGRVRNPKGLAPEQRLARAVEVLARDAREEDVTRFLRLARAFFKE